MSNPNAPRPDQAPDEREREVMIGYPKTRLSLDEYEAIVARIDRYGDARHREGMLLAAKSICLRCRKGEPALHEDPHDGNGPTLKAGDFYHVENRPTGGPLWERCRASAILAELETPKQVPDASACAWCGRSGATELVNRKRLYHPVCIALLDAVS